MKKASIGVDIGGTNTCFGIVDESGNVLERGLIPTPTKDDVKKYIVDLSAGIKKLMKQVDGYEFVGIGIGAPNANYYTGNIEHAANLAFKGIVPIVNLLKEQFPDIHNIIMTNDANAAALGEMIYGGAKGMKNFIMVTLGTGLGSGFVVNGELVYGHDGFAGELGHITVTPEGRECGCGQFGHLETYCSATGMVRTAFELLSHHNAKESLLADKTFNQLTSKDIFDAARKGDEIALTVFEITGDILGQALADTIHITSPEAIFLFGGPVASGELLFKPTRESMESHLMPVFKNKVKLLPSQLRMGDAAIVGASALVARK
ncbi:MAG TPA: ROK family protein [Prolixibacteraceae bacterium]|nr:ROK family protein [Prolixibacteraceae bacterium]HPS12822.1 ROK family protein [Prolixibacteraceae bacterium]